MLFMAHSGLSNSLVSWTVMGGTMKNQGIEVQKRLCSVGIMAHYYWNDGYTIGMVAILLKMWLTIGMVAILLEWWLYY